MKKILIFLLLYFYGMACMAQNAQTNSELALHYLEVVSKNKYHQIIHIDSVNKPKNEYYEHFIVEIDTTKDVKKGKYGIVLHDNEQKISLYIFEKQQNSWKNVFYEDSIELYSSHLTDIVKKDFNDDGIDDILIKGTDGGVRNGQDNLYVFDNNTYKKVKGIAQLGHFYKLEKYRNKSYYYSNYICGCVGKCWDSDLFNINKNELQIIGRMGCNCEAMEFFKKTDEGYQLINSISPCDKYSKLNYNEVSIQYWTKVIREGF
jgi:hypothetical protein